MKKNIFILLILSLVLIFTLCSCGGNTDTSSDTANTTDTSKDTSSDTSQDTGTEACKHANVVVDEAVYATCVSEGLTKGSHCGDCGEVLEAQSTTPKTEHYVVEGGYQAPTCAAPGHSGGL